MRREVLVGTEVGGLHVVMVDEQERRERLWAPLLQLDCPAPAITTAYHQVPRPHLLLAPVAVRT